MIHSLDSPRLAEALQRAAEAADRSVDTLIEVNVAGEQSKFGLAPEGVRPLLGSIAGSLDRLRVRGLMTMAPYVDDPETVRPVFQRLRELRDRLAAEGFDLPQLSMGMTNDYEVAVEEGATMVRVGTAIFGPREA
jgi:pyridoxal phosphate enzyme (YggS family)